MRQQAGWLLLGAWLGLGMGAAAQSGPAPGPNTPEEPGFRVARWLERHEISADGRDTATYTSAHQVLKPGLLEAFKRGQASYSKSAQSLQVLEAYTLKPNGRRIPVSKTNYQLRENKGLGGQSPAFSDINTMQVVFPELAVGDTVVLSYRIKTLEPLFPGRVSLWGRFPREMAYDDVRVQIVTPAQFPARFKAREMEEKITLAGGKRSIEWQRKAPEPVISKRRDYSVIDPEAEPGYAFTSFESYADIAQHYGRRAQPKAAVTPRLQRLAQEITQGIEDRREQLRAVYDWVATEIGYGGNCIGIGAVVPREPEWVLENRLGDCKDHATLVQALLAAKGIASEQALINAGSVYRLPEIPVVQMVNHVINYVPEFDLFLDATSDDTPFGWLPASDQGKPVLLARTDGRQLRTPAMPPAPAAQQLRSRLVLDEQGGVSGREEVTLQGQMAASARSHFKHLNPSQEKELVRNLFSRIDPEAEGTLSHGDDQQRTADYHYSAEFKARGLLPLPGQGGFHIAPMLYSPMALQQLAQAALAPLDETEVSCFGGSTREDFEITLPEPMKVLSLPDDLKHSTALIEYEARYRLDGRVLSVQRQLLDRSEGPICSPQTMAELRTSLQPVLKNLRQQVLYR